MNKEPVMETMQVTLKWKPHSYVNETITTACEFSFSSGSNFGTEVSKEEMEFQTDKCIDYIWKQIQAIKEKYYVEKESNKSNGKDA